MLGGLLLGWVQRKEAETWQASGCRVAVGDLQPCLRKGHFGAQFPCQDPSPLSNIVLLPPSILHKLIQFLVSMEKNSANTAVSSSAFTRSLEGFRRRLSAEDLENFELTTFESLELAIKEIQRAQAQRRALRNLNKVKPFLRFLQDYARVIEQFVSAKPDFLAFIWVSVNAASPPILHSTDNSRRDPSNYASKYGLSLLPPNPTADV